MIDILDTYSNFKNDDLIILYLAKVYLQKLNNITLLSVLKYTVLYVKKIEKIYMYIINKNIMTPCPSGLRGST
jgi:hypothetical protein